MPPAPLPRAAVRAIVGGVTPVYARIVRSSVLLFALVALAPAAAGAVPPLPTTPTVDPGADPRTRDERRDAATAAPAAGETAYFARWAMGLSWNRLMGGDPVTLSSGRFGPEAFGMGVAGEYAMGFRVAERTFVTAHFAVGRVLNPRFEKTTRWFNALWSFAPAVGIHRRFSFFGTWVGLAVGPAWLPGHEFAGRPQRWFQNRAADTGAAIIAQVGQSVRISDDVSLGAMLHVQYAAVFTNGVRHFVSPALLMTVSYR